MHSLARTVSGDGPPVVWLHGYTMDSSIWEHVWAAMPGWRHIGIDLVGHGGTADDPEVTLNEQARAIVEVMRGEGAQALVALSMSTIVALEVASIATVSALALIAPAYAGMPAEPETVAKYRQLGVAYALGASTETMTDIWMTSPPPIFSHVPRQSPSWISLHSAISRHGWSELTHGGMQFLYRDQQDPLRVGMRAANMMVFTGPRDMKPFRDFAFELGRRPQTQLIDVPDAGHLPIFECPELVIRPLKNFLYSAYPREEESCPQ